MIESLARHSIIYAGAAIIARGSQVLMLLLLPALLLPADYGALQIIVTIAILANLVMPLEVTQGLARHYPAASDDEKKAYSSTAWWFTLAAVLVWCVSAFLAAEWLTVMVLGTRVYLRLFELGLVFIALRSIFYFQQNQFRWMFDARGYALVSILFAGCSVLGALGLAMLLDPPVMGAMVGLVAGALVAVALGAMRLRGLFRLVIDSAKLRQMLAFSLPLVPAQLCVFATVHGTRLIVNDAASLHEVGLYTYAGQIAAVASLATIGINAALTPLIMAHHEDPQTPLLLGRLFEGFVAASICLCLILGLFAPELITMLGAPAYAAAAPLVLVLAPAALLVQMYIFAPGFVVTKKTSLQLLVSVASGCVTVAATYALVDRWGILGAAFGNLIGASVFLGLWLILSQRLYRIGVRWARVALAVAAGAVLGWLGAGIGSGSYMEVGAKLLLVAAAAAVGAIAGLFPLALIERQLPLLKAQLRRA